MVVRTQNNGREVFGLHVGIGNARRYFPRSAGAVELQLDELRIECRLPETFWNGRPEIHDPRLCEWLKFKIIGERRDRSPIELHMVRSGLNTFTLESMVAPHRRASRLTSAA